jgi:hypothetical protein
MEDFAPHWVDASVLRPELLHPAPGLVCGWPRPERQRVKRALLPRACHFFLAAAVGFRFALLRPSYFASRAGADKFLLFRLLIAGPQLVLPKFVQFAGSKRAGISCPLCFATRSGVLSERDQPTPIPPSHRLLQARAQLVRSSSFQLASFTICPSSGPCSPVAAASTIFNPLGKTCGHRTVCSTPALMDDFRECPRFELL